MGLTAPPRPPELDDRIDRAELEALVEALIEEARQRTRRRRRRYNAAVALLGLIVLAVFTAFGRSAQPQSAASAAAARSSLATATATPRIAFIAEPWSGGYAGVINVMNADGSGRRRLTPGLPGMRWSPDGQRIAFVPSHPDPVEGLHVMNADGSELMQLTTGPVRSGWGGSLPWSPEGRTIAFGRLQGVGVLADLYVIGSDGGTERLLARDTAGGFGWSPDSTQIAFIRGSKSSPWHGRDWELWVVSADASGQRRLARTRVRYSEPVWSPDGKQIAFVSNWQVHVVNDDGSGERRLTYNGARNFAPAWSPDGRRIAFERRIGRRQSSRPCSGCGSALAVEVWVMNADGSGQRRLTREGGRNSAPAWSPDGQKIAFVSRRDRNTEIYVTNADGTSQRNLTRTPRAHETSFSWSPGP